MIASVLVSLTVTALSKVALCRWYIESHVEAAAVTEDVALKWESLLISLHPLKN